MKERWSALLRYLRLAALPMGAQLGVSLLCLALWQRQVAELALPRGGWQGALAYFTLAAPLWSVDTLPPTGRALLPALLVQSVFFGLLTAALLRGVLDGHWRPTQAGRAMRAVSMAIVLAVAIAGLGAGVAVYRAVDAIGGHHYALASAQLHGQREKTRWLGKFLRLPGRVLATEYQLGLTSGGIGPSGWEYCIAVKVPPSQVDRWVHLPHDQFTPGAPVDSGTCASFFATLRGPTWTHHGTAETYTEANGAHATLYRRDGIVLLHLIR